MTTRVALSEVLGALSYALDITEGEPPGHAIRTTAIGMRLGEPQRISLTEQMADKGPLWEEMTARHGLRQFAYDGLVAWPFADYVFGTDWDVMSDVTKSSLHGFHDVIDSEAMFERLLRRFRKEKIVP